MLNKQEQEFLNAAENGDIPRMQRLLRGGLFSKAVDLNVTNEDYYQRNALMIAVRQHMDEAALWLIDQGIDVFHRNMRGATALMELYDRQGSSLVAEAMIDAILAHPDHSVNEKLAMFLPTGQSEWSILHHTTASQHRPMADFLIRHFSHIPPQTLIREAGRESGALLLAHAITAGREDVVLPALTLVSKELQGKRLVAFLDALPGLGGRRPEHAAAEAGKPQMAHAIHQARLLANRESADAQYVIDLITDGDLEEAELCIRTRKFQLLSDNPRNGRSSIFVTAVTHGHQELVKTVIDTYLIHADAADRRKLILAIQAPQAALALARANGHAELARYLEETAIHLQLSIGDRDVLRRFIAGGDLARFEEAIRSEHFNFLNHDDAYNLLHMTLSEGDPRYGQAAFSRLTAVYGEQPARLADLVMAALINDVSAYEFIKANPHFAAITADMEALFLSTGSWPYLQRMIAANDVSRVYTCLTVGTYHDLDAPAISGFLSLAAKTGNPDMVATVMQCLAAPPLPHGDTLVELLSRQKGLLEVWRAEPDILRAAEANLADILKRMPPQTLADTLPDYSVLNLAATIGDLELAEHALAAFIEIYGNDPARLVAALEEPGHFHPSAPLETARQAGHLPIVHLLQHHHYTAVQNSKFAQTLATAITEADFPMLERLYKNGVRQGTYSWDTALAKNECALTLAARHDSESQALVEWLLHHGARPDMQGKDGNTLLHLNPALGIQGIAGYYRDDPVGAIVALAAANHKAQTMIVATKISPEVWDQFHDTVDAIITALTFLPATELTAERDGLSALQALKRLGLSDLLYAPHHWAGRVDACIAFSEALHDVQTATTGQIDAIAAYETLRIATDKAALFHPDNTGAIPLSYPEVWPLLPETGRRLAAHGAPLTVGDFLESAPPLLPAIIAAGHFDKVVECLAAGRQYFSYDDIIAPVGKASLLTQVLDSGQGHALFRPEAWAGRVDDLRRLWDRVPPNHKRALTGEGLSLTQVISAANGASLKRGFTMA